MPPLIPYEFEPPATDYEEAHLEYEDTPAGKLVSWPLIGATLLLPKGNQYTEFEQIEALNQEKFQSYGLFGFSINRYHEFLVSMPNERHVCFKMGNIEATFGQVTPLGVLLFDPYHREKYFGAWEYLISLRIIGAEFHEAELAFLNACIAYEEKFGVLPDKFPLDESLILDEAFDFEEDYTPKTFISPPLATNLDPLQFFHNGLSQPDEIAACIYFYRNARIFFLLHNEAEMRRLRHDYAQRCGFFAAHT